MPSRCGVPGSRPIRGRVLHRLGELMERDRDELARLSVLDNGMTATMSPLLVDLMTSWTSYYAGWADKIEGRVTSSPSQQRELGYTMPEPYGVVGIILTWNGPLVSVGMKLIPALAAGNTVVMKPSELTPYATEYLMTLIREAGIPAGVVNLLLGGPEAGEALVRHELVKKVTFTGGPATARKILAAVRGIIEASGVGAGREVGQRDLPGCRPRPRPGDQRVRRVRDACRTRMCDCHPNDRPRRYLRRSGRTDPSCRSDSSLRRSLRPRNRRGARRDEGGAAAHPRT